MKQVVEEGRFSVAVVRHGNAWVGVDGVAGLSAADSAHNPSDGGDPFVVAPPKEGKTEKADLVQQSDGELPSGGAFEEDITDGEVMGSGRAYRS